MVAIVDYDAGNLRSVEKAIQTLGTKTVITRNADEILSADKVILPGVGSFGDAMEKLAHYDLIDTLRQTAVNKIPILGICLGMQVLFESSEECPGVEGLGILKGQILKIPSSDGLKVPHMGWNSLTIAAESRLFNEINSGAFVYFVHSYYLSAKDVQIVAATTDYSTVIHAAIESEHIYGCQFHPEKSSKIGLKILQNFVELV